MNGVLCVSLHRKWGSNSRSWIRRSLPPALPPSDAAVCPVSFIHSSLFRRVSVIVRYIPRKSLSASAAAMRKSDGDIDWMGSARTKFPLSEEGYREGIPTTARRKEKKKKKKVGRRMTISPSTFLSFAAAARRRRRSSFLCRPRGRHRECGALVLVPEQRRERL